MTASLSPTAWLQQQLLAHDLRQHMNSLQTLALPCLRFTLEPVAEDACPLGASRFGGRPDLPGDALWPQRRGRPLDFLFQLNLAALPHLPLPPGCTRALPTAPNGVLLFFYDCDDQPWGLAPEDAEGWSLLHIPAEVPLLRWPLPEGVTSTAASLAAEAEEGTDDLDFGPCFHPVFSVGWSLPDPETPEVAALGLTPEEMQRYEALLEALQPAPQEASQEDQKAPETAVSDNDSTPPRLDAAIEPETAAEAVRMAEESLPEGAVTGVGWDPETGEAIAVDLPQHQLFGHAAALLHDPRQDCRVLKPHAAVAPPAKPEPAASPATSRRALFSRFGRVLKDDNPSPAQAEAQAAKARQTEAQLWRLLVQIDSDPDAELVWHDFGRLYLFLTEEAMRKGDWQSVWVVQQG